MKLKLNQFLTIPFLILFFVILPSCTKNSNSSQKKEQMVLSDEEQTPNLQAEIANFKPSIPIEKIDKLTVESFSLITVSLLEQQIMFTQELLKKGIVAANETESESETAEFISYQNQFKNDFFAKWNITDNDYSHFGITRNQEIQNYFNDHEELREKMNKLQALLQQIQEGSHNESDEYNIKDADAIISNTPDN